MHVERCGFGEAVGWLRDRFGDAKTVQTVTRQVERILVEQPRRFVCATDTQPAELGVSAIVFDADPKTSGCDRRALA